MCSSDLGLQASGIANDAFASTYGLAACVCSLRFASQGRFKDCFFAVVATALLSGTKASNLPWLLPITAVLTWGVIRWGKSIPSFFLRAASLSLLAAWISFLPTAWMNHRFCHDWTGTSLEGGRFVNSPWVGLAGNVLQVFAQNFSPPILPGARELDQALVERIPPSLLSRLRQNFEGAFFFGLGELPTEASGLGLGLSLCLLVAALQGRLTIFRPPPPRSGTATLMLWLAPLSLLLFLSKSALAGVSRVILPYFPVAMAPILAGGNSCRLIRNRFFRALVLFSFLSALGAVILDPSKPLWPAQPVLASPVSWPWLEKIRARALAVYKNYRQRSEVFQAARALVPPGTPRLGFFNGTDDPVASLWKPYGTLRVEEITSDETAADLQRRGLSLILGGEKGILERRGQTLDQWQSSLGATPIGKVTLQPAVQRGNEVWVLLAIPPGPPDVEPR